MKHIIQIGLIFSLLMLAGCASDNDITDRPIGGDRDEHGCLPAAGYQWCPSTGKCQRMWEEYCDEFSEQFRGNDTKAGIASFEDCVAAGNPVMESYPRQCRAEGKTFVEEIEPLPE